MHVQIITLVDDIKITNYQFLRDNLIGCRSHKLIFFFFLYEHVKKNYKLLTDPLISLFFFFPSFSLSPNHTNILPPSPLYIYIYIYLYIYFFFFFEKKSQCIRIKLQWLQYHEYKEDTPHTIIFPHQRTEHISQAYEQPHLLCVLHG
jgi:hypothetical protein